MTAKSTPYASATSCDRARAEVTKLLRQFGCEKIGFMDHYATQELLLAFEHRGRRAARRRQGLGGHVAEGESLAQRDAALAARIRAGRAATRSYRG
jgi:hypothetical protein